MYSIQELLSPIDFRSDADLRVSLEKERVREKIKKAVSSMPCTEELWEDSLDALDMSSVECRVSAACIDTGTPRLAVM